MPVQTLARALMLCAALALPASAQTGADARAAYDAGDFATALALAEPLAEAGDPVAGNVMGLLHEFGDGGVAIDTARAVAYFEAAAATGYPNAQYNLGIILLDGIDGIAPDPERSFALMHAAHEQGFALATFELAMRHWDGLGTPVDTVEARRLMEIAAEADDPWALNNLGVMAEDGIGGPEDPGRALSIYRRSSQLGYALAGANVANLLLEAEPLSPEGRIEAIAWCLWAGRAVLDGSADQAEPGEVAGECAPVLDGVAAADLAAAEAASAALPGAPESGQ